MPAIQNRRAFESPITSIAPWSTKKLKIILSAIIENVHTLKHLQIQSIPYCSHSKQEKLIRLLRNIVSDYVLEQSCRGKQYVYILHLWQSMFTNPLKHVTHPNFATWQVICNYFKYYEKYFQLLKSRHKKKFKTTFQIPFEFFHLIIKMRKI